MSILERLIASLVERVFGNKVTSIIGVLVIAAGVIGGAGKAFPSNLMLYGFHVQSALVTLAAIVGGVALLLAKDSGVKVSAPSPVILLLVALSLMCAGPLAAQAPPAPAPAPVAAAPGSGVQNLYGAGMSYSVNASPAIAGTAIYAHQVNGSGTYAFTAIDAVPATLKPFAVTSNVGVGVAQKVATVGKIPIFMPTSAGISWSGTNTGWQWNGGAVAVIPLKSGYYLMPTVRFLKSSVSSGSGYQPIIGLLFGWGK